MTRLTVDTRVTHCLVRALLGALVAIALGRGSASAATISFNSLANWQAAITGSVVTTTFEENVSATYTAHGPIATFDGVTYSVNAGGLYTVDPDYNTAYAALGTGDVLSAQGGAGILTVNVAGAREFGFDWHSGGGPFMNVFLSTGDVFSIPAVAGQVGFFGITSTQAVSSFTIQVPGILNLDNFRVVSTLDTAPVPEPATLLLVAAPLVIALRLRPRR